MARPSGKFRFTSLMNDIGWKDRNDWTDDTIAAELLPFMEWVTANEQFIVDLVAADAFHSFYFTDDVGDPNRSYYLKLERGRAALAAVYASQAQQRQAWNDLYEIIKLTADQFDDLVSDGTPVMQSTQEILATRLCSDIVVLLRLGCDCPLHDLIVRILNIGIQAQQFGQVIVICTAASQYLEDIPIEQMREIERIEKLANKELYKKYGNRA